MQGGLKSLYPCKHARLIPQLINIIILDPYLYELYFYIHLSGARICDSKLTDFFFFSFIFRYYDRETYLRNALNNGLSISN